MNGSGAEVLSAAAVGAGGHTARPTALKRERQRQAQHDWLLAELFPPRPPCSPQHWPLVLAINCAAARVAEYF